MRGDSLMNMSKSTPSDLRARLARAALRREIYDADGVEVQVRELTARELADLHAANAGKPELEQGAALAAAAAVDDAGDRVFADAGDALDLPIRHVQALAELAAKVSGLTPEPGQEGEAEPGKSPAAPTP